MNITYDNNDFPVNSGAIKKEMALFLLKNYLDVDSNSSRKYRQIAKNLGIKKLKKVNSKDWNADISREWTKAHTTALNQIQELPIDKLVSFTNKKLKSSGEKNIERLSTLKGRSLKINEFSDGDLLATAFAEPEETEKSKKEIKFTESQRKEYLNKIIKAKNPTTKVDTTSAKYEKDEKNQTVKDEDGNKKLIAGKEATTTTKAFKFAEPTTEDFGKLKLLADKKVKGISLIRAGGNISAETGETKPLTQFNYLNRGNYSDRSKKEKTALAWDKETSAMDERLTNEEAMNFLSRGLKETSFANKLITQYIKAYKSEPEKIMQNLDPRIHRSKFSRIQRVRNPLELKEKLYNLKFLFGKVYKTDDKELETIDDSFDKLLEQYKEYNSFKDKNPSLKQKNMPRIISNMTVLLSKIKRNIKQHSSELKEKLDSLQEVRADKEKKESTSSREITKSTDAKKAFDDFNNWFSSKDGFFADLIADNYHLYSFEIIVKKTITRKIEEDKLVSKTNYEFVSFKIAETHEISRGSANTRVKSGKQKDEQGYRSKYSKRAYSPKSLYDLPSEDKQSLRYFVSSIQSGIEKLQNKLNN